LPTQVVPNQAGCVRDTHCLDGSDRARGLTKLDLHRDSRVRRPELPGPRRPEFRDTRANCYADDGARAGSRRGDFSSVKSKRSDRDFPLVQYLFGQFWMAAGKYADKGSYVRLDATDGNPQILLRCFVKHFGLIFLSIS
jgi:hypothetical protein